MVGMTWTELMIMTSYTYILLMVLGELHADKGFCLQLTLVEERRWLLTNVKSSVELHAGYGLISTIKWRDCLIAWANEKVSAVQLSS